VTPGAPPPPPVEAPWWVTPTPPEAVVPTPPPAAAPARSKRAVTFIGLAGIGLGLASVGAGLVLLWLLPAPTPPAPSTVAANSGPRPPAKVAPKIVDQLARKAQPPIQQPPARETPVDEMGPPALTTDRTKNADPPGPQGKPPSDAGPQPPASIDAKVQKLIQALDAPAKADRLAAMKALGSKGTAAKAAIPVLIERLRDDSKDHADQAEQAARTLAQIGWPAVPELVKALDDPSPAVRRRALWALAVIGPDAREALPRLCEMLQVKDVTTRMLAAQALIEMGPVARPALPLLVKALRDPEGEVRFLAARALHEISPDTVDHLVPLLKDDDWSLRLSAVLALPMFVERTEAIQALADALRDPHGKVRGAAAAALVQLGPKADAAVPTLIGYLRDDDPERQAQAFAALMAIGVPPGSKLLADLGAMNFAEGKKWAGADLTGGRKDEVKRLAAALDDPNATRRLGAVLALGQMGPDAKEAVPRLWKAFARENNRAVLAAMQLVLPALDPKHKLEGKSPVTFLAEMGKSLKAAGKMDPEELVQLYILTATISHPNFQPGQDDAKLQEIVVKTRDWAAQTIDNMAETPGFLPALTWGVNVTAEFTLGFTEPFTRLNAKLRTAARETKDTQALNYILGHLGERVSPDSAMFVPIQLDWLVVVNNAALLDVMISTRQQVLTEIALMKLEKDLQQQLRRLKMILAQAGRVPAPVKPGLNERAPVNDGPKPHLYDQIWNQPVTAFMWNLGSDDAATGPGGKRYYNGWGVTYRSGTKPDQPAPFDPFWNLLVGKMSWNLYSSTIISVIPQFWGPAKAPATPVTADSGGKSPKPKDVVVPREPPGLILKEDTLKSKIVHWSPELIKPIQRTGTGTSTQQGTAPPKVDLVTLVQVTEWELALLLLLKQQNTMLTTEEMLQKLAREDEAALLAKLRDPDPATRALAALVIGQKRLPAAKQLVPLLSDPVADVREAAHQALVRLARGTDHGPAPTDSPARVTQATERWSNWVAEQEPLPTAIDVDRKGK
jgi:HEAT repeat protein